ncbi:MAG: hypothetical protein ACM3OO_06390 [Planctomycetaceae bacterium]
MSQIDVASTTAIQGRGADRRARVEAFVRDFEWTWTNAVPFAFTLVFFLLITSAVMPSFWMYYAEQQLGWGGPTDLVGFLQAFPSQPLGKETLLMIRDAIAMGMTTGPIITVLVVSAALQNWRKRLRGGAGEARPSGGYR